MSTNSISGLSSSYSLANTSQDSTFSLASDKESFGAAVVSKTIDYLNSGSSNSHGSDMAQTYDFNKTVLGGHAASLGAVTDINI